MRAMFQKVPDWFARRFRRFANVLPNAFQYHLYETVMPFFKGVFGFLLIPIVMPIKLLFSAVYLFGPWWGSSQVRHLLYGLPSVLVLALVIYILTMAKINLGAGKRSEKYITAATSAVKRSEWKEAKLYYQRAIDMGISTPAVRFELARVAEKTNDIPLLIGTMQSLAPADKAVFAPAHLWQAVRLLSGNDVTVEVAGEAEQHLKLALELEPETTMAHALLGDLYFQEGLLPSAIYHLLQTDRKSAHYRLLLAKALVASGNVDRAKSVAGELLPAAKELSEVEPRNVQARLDYAEATVFSGDFEKAADILQEGLQIADDGKLREAITMVLIQWSDTLIDKSPENREQAFQLLAAGFQYAPNEVILFDRVVKILKANDAASSDAEKFLVENIATGRAVGLSHFILGTYLYEAKRENGGFHLIQAFQLLSNGAIVANNYSWYLMKSDPPNLDQALNVINEVVKNFPDNPEFRDTKGHVLMAMERWQEAIVEFEATLEPLGNRVASHEALENAYEKLGNTEIAERHRSIVATLRKRQETAN